MAGRSKNKNHFNFPLSYLVFFLIVSGLISESNSQGFGEVIEARCRYVKADANRLYERQLRKDEAIMYIFYIDRKYFLDAANTNLRMEVEVGSRTSLQDPILFSVGQPKYINTFELPVVLMSPSENNVNPPVFYSAGRNLCIQRGDEGQNITVRISTSSTRYVGYRLKLILTEDFQIPLQKEFTLEVSPTSPQYLGFMPSRPDLSVIKIKANSETSDCLTLSVQTPRCPIYDKETNVRYQGLWQTMTTQTAMTLELKRRFENGFILVLVAHASNEKCLTGSSYVNPYEPPPSNNGTFSEGTSPIGDYYKSEKKKVVKLIVTNEGDVPKWKIFLVLALPVFITLLLLIVVTLLFRNRHQWMRVEAEQKLTAINIGFVTSLKEDPSNPRNRRALMRPSDNLVLHDLGVLPMPSHEEDEEENEELAVNNGHQSTEDTIGQFYEKRQRGRDNGSKFRWKANLYISDFVQKDASCAKKSGRRFYWILVIVSIFYCIPVYQLIMHYLRVLYRTGEYDICYYNYLCAHRLGLLVDFNHFWSNVSYIILGLSFIFFVSRRANNMKEIFPPGSKRGHNSSDSELGDDVSESFLKRCCGYSRIPIRSDYGIPINWGIYYALGIALAMEGVLSAAYHLCPNQSSFQFDTCFMYVIAVLILLKIYQFRHSEHFGANRTFAILAAFVLISVIGLMFEFQGSRAKIVYRWTFVALQFIVMTLISIYGYALGYARTKDSRRIVTGWKIFGHMRQLSGNKINCDRLIHPIISFLLGIAVLIYCELSHADFATYLLYVLIANVIGSTLYYVGIMKPLHGEFKNRTWVQPALYFLGAGIIGGFAVTYFVNSPAEWELSAALSRAGNEECMKSWFPFYPYYDTHDVWHFYSAFALFLSFMALLIVDDDLLTIPQTKIHVF